MPTVIPTLQTASVGAAYSTVRTGGDFFEFLHTNSNVLFLAMFDIAGKRAAALELAADLQSTMRERADALLQQHGNVNDALSALTLELNREIIQKEGVHNSPAFIAAYEEETAILSYINAGHTPALLRDQDGVEELGAGGVPLGLFSHVVHEPRLTVVRDGAVLIIPSRGVVEAKAGSKEFGLDGVREVIVTANYDSASELSDTVVKSAETFISAPGFWGPRISIPGFSDHEPNDITVIALMRPAAGATATAAAR